MISLQDLYNLIASNSSTLVDAMVLTLEITFIGFTAGIALGLLISLGRRYGPLPLRIILASYIELIRGTPMLVQLFFIYYALPTVGVKLDAFSASILAIGLNSAAYQAEYFRMAYGAVPREQWEAALSIGLGKGGALVNVIIPQAVRIVMPALTNEAIYLLKYSSIAYFVTVPELVYVSKVIGARTLMYMEIYTFTAVFYIIVTIALFKASEILQSRIAIPGLVVRGRT